MMEEEISELRILREELDFIFKQSSLIKRDLRLGVVDTSELIKRTETIAIFLDATIDKVYEGELRQKYDNHSKFFDLYYDFRECYKSYMLFYDDEFSRHSDSEDDRIKSYFNYLMEHLIKLNHFAMSLEFQELYQQLSVEE
jgi:hypothetical protein